MYIHPNGIGGATGDSLALAKPLYTSEPVHYVDSQTGNAFYSGRDRKAPFLTIAAAVSAIGASDGHIIVCLDGHTEEVSTTITLAQAVTIIGEGLDAGIPTVTLTIGHITNDVILVTADNCEVRNIRFLSGNSAVAPISSTASCIRTTSADGLTIHGCHFDVDQRTNGPAVEVGATSDHETLKRCVFRSTAYGGPGKPEPDSAVRSMGAGSPLTFDGCTFDGGAEGFNDGSGNNWAFDGSAAATPRLRVTDLTLLNGADFKVHASSKGYISAPTTTGSSVVIW
jgi:hypothetical protein